MIRLAILALLVTTQALACEIGGCGFGPPTSPEWDRERTAENNSRMLRGLEDCKARRAFGSVCHGYCRSGAYRFDRKRFCDAYDNFRSGQ